MPTRPGYGPRPSRIQNPSKQANATSTEESDVQNKIDPHHSFLGKNIVSDEQIQLMTKCYEDFKNGESKKNSQSVKQLIEKMVAENGTIAEKIDMKPEQLENIYNVGYQCFQQGNYKKAVGIFRLLFVMNPLETKYIFSLGLSLEKDKQIYPASTAYLLNTFLDETNPVPTFRVGVCFLEMKENIVAQAMFLKTIELCKGRENFTNIAERATLFLKGLQEEKLKTSAPVNA